MSKTPISADSHITEPPNLYIDHIDPKFRDRAPHVVDDPKRGEIYVIPGMDGTIPMSARLVTDFPEPDSPTSPSVSPSSKG